MEGRGGAYLKFPGIPHHQVKVCIIVDRCTDSTVVVKELLLCHLGVKYTRSCCKDPGTNLAVWMIWGIEVVQKFFKDLLFCPLTIHVFGVGAHVVDTWKWKCEGSRPSIQSHECTHPPPLTPNSYATNPFRSATVTTPSPFPLPQIAMQLTLSDLPLSPHHPPSPYPK